MVRNTGDQGGSKLGINTGLEKRAKKMLLFETQTIKIYVNVGSYPFVITLVYLSRK